ncbi:MAG: type I 3-dehydroquinate dehydratase [Candidatus Tenebribacter davisii]|nr:type I 3-dehydroquinate dehydratase [Candidatus Tenebribacter davisii]
MIILSIPYLDNDFVFQKSEENPDQWKEYRLDYSRDLHSFPSELINDKTIITIRSKNEGGKYDFDLIDKIEFYSILVSKTNCLCDLEINEIDQHDISSIPAENLILSYHNFSEDIDYKKLKDIIKKLDSIPSKYIKIAVRISKYNDLIKITKLISQTTKPVIFAGMGKLGKISRILFKHLGADATFIGLPGNNTAEGQLIKEEVELFKLRSISANTQIGGIIGGRQVEQSLGIKYYNELFTKEKLDAVYLPLITDDFDDLWNWIKTSKIDLYGFSITMPYKKKFGTQKGLDAINLFLPKTDEMLNTDLIAFQRSLEILSIQKNYSILIVGSGATAETALQALNDFKKVNIASRNELTGRALAQAGKRNFISLNLLRDCQFDLIINCTPIGTNKENLLRTFTLKLPKSVIDLPYIQNNTLLITNCIENEVKFIDGNNFWILQSKIHQQRFIIAILNEEG